MTLLLPQTNQSAEPATYTYSYPHKSAYRRLNPPVSIDDAWRNEDRSRLFLYVHIPFCEMRCGFCNLFTASQPPSAVMDAYLQTLSRQIEVVHRRLPNAKFVQLAIGGGTPTMLSAEQLSRLLDELERRLACQVRMANASVETSPDTAIVDRLQVLANYGVERISLGVQSFDAAETGRIGRPQQPAQVHAALERIRALPFGVLNIDLIYGHPQQQVSAWLASLHDALRYQPEELYLYPLYVRPETGLGRTGQQVASHRVDLYRRAREFLLAEGYRQISLRCFRRAPAQLTSEKSYSCQSDGMVGLGCGARSYTSDLHYSTRFAVSQAGVRAILNDWIAIADEELGYATHGIRLDADEQRRRFVILSLLQHDGLTFADYAARFRGDPMIDYPELAVLIERQWAEKSTTAVMLTAKGMENSDQIGVRLYSNATRAHFEEFAHS